MGLDWNAFDQRRIAVHDASLLVRSAGQGPPLVLLHGFPQHSLMWRRVAPALAENFTVIVPDQRGMGASTIMDGPFTKSDMADDLATILDQLGHPSAFIAGYDLGAGVAAAFARKFPQRCRALAAMEFVLAGFGLEEAMAPKKDWTVESNWHFTILALPDVAVWLFARREREMLDWFFGHGSYLGTSAVAPPDLAEYARLLSRPGALRSGAQYYAAIFRDGEENAPLRDHPLKMPVHVIGGEANAAPIIEAAWKAIAPVISSTMIAKAGHWLMDEAPAATTAALHQFFSSIEGSKT